MSAIFQQAQFLKTVVNLADLPEDIGHEVAVLGRSNVGKSSTLNALTGQKSLARTSKTPGRTQAINIFTLKPVELKLIDLPGYGFAKASQSAVKSWHQLIDGYLRQRQCLAGLVLIMDIRHPLQPLDKDMLQWLVTCDIPVHIVLNKSDKLSRMQAQKALHSVEQFLADDPDITLQTFSASKKQGLDTLRQQIMTWFTANE